MKPDVGIKLVLPELPKTADINITEPQLHQMLRWWVQEETGKKVTRISWDIDRDGDMQGADVTVEL